ncbi:hypothetical protein PFISCL1PPCAC_22537, partial [Pristionchus fissidentatus]
DGWNDLTQSYKSTERVAELMEHALELMKCLVEKDLEKISLVNEELRKLMHVAMSIDGKTLTFGTRNLLYGMIDSLHVTVRAMIETGRLDGCRATEQRAEVATAGLCSAVDAIALMKEVKQEEDEDEMLQEGTDCTLPGPANIDDGQEIKYELDVKEEPLCPPLVDTITIGTGPLLLHRTNPPSPPLAGGRAAPPTKRYFPAARSQLPLGFRKARLRDYLTEDAAPMLERMDVPSTSEAPSPASVPSTSHTSDPAPQPTSPAVTPWYTSMRCTYCGRFFGDEKKFKEHMLLHKLRPYLCVKCGYTYKRKIDLVRHERIHASGIEPSCSICGQRFQSLKDKDIHVRTKHRCEECNVRFDRDDVLAWHIKNSHKK